MKKSKEEPRKEEPKKEEPARKDKKTKAKKKSFFSDERIKFVFGVLLFGFAVYLLIALIAYLFWWKTDLSLDSSQVISGSDVQVKNWSGKSGAWFAMLLVNKGFGLGAFFIPVIIGTIGLYLLNFPKIRVWKMIFRFTFAAIILSLCLGFVFGKSVYLGSGPGGAHGYLASQWLNAFMGKIGTAVLLTLITISYLIFALNVSPSAFILRMPTFLRKKDLKAVAEDSGTSGEMEGIPGESLNGDEEAGEDEGEDVQFHVINTTDKNDSTGHADLVETSAIGGAIIHEFDSENNPVPVEGAEIPINITKAEAGDLLSEEEVQKIMENYDPRLDLPRYKFPPVSILADHKSASSFDNAEVIENKENIIKTLGDHKIPIKHISATVGPTVTLYEIVPERGVRLAKIKSLENDIALNLSALGIRIIAPIPGRGTVGIEVPNKKPETVSMRSLITSKAFQETKFDIALALGRTITNDPYIVDLTKMPHLLVAGATGQGKSVGINAIITSILYKKHPSEVKFVLIDPKRVELPLYMKIERHFLAKLPGEEDAIITDTQKVINTLNSLCIEMDNRLELLKMAQSRNIKEYNEKFVSRRLNPEKGHRYMPYIVLIIDEFADLIMTAGREIEGPIGRLAQLGKGNRCAPYHFNSKTISKYHYRFY